MSAIDHLNEKQREAATTIYGVNRVIAGPGTGKTATKTARIAHMLEQGIDPKQIVALTFTNKAADEMKQRIIDQSGNDGHYVFAGTYHKFFIQKILTPNKSHEYFKKLGYHDGFFTLDSGDADRLMQQTLKKLQPGHALIKEVFDINKKEMFRWMSNYRAHGLMAHEVLKHFAKDQDLKDTYHLFEATSVRMAKEGYTPEEAERELSDIIRQNTKVLDVFKAKAIWRSYTKESIDMEGMDFDDVLVHSHRLLLSDPTIAKRLCNQYRFFSLDEYQDTNNVQHAVIHSIATAGDNKPNIFSVGDIRQSIYGFRFADIRLMSEMHKRYENVKDIALTVNYRSSSALLNATNAMAIEMNGQVTDGQLEPPHFKSGDKPTIAYFSNDGEEATWIVDQIQAQVERGEDISQTAILYRSRPLRQRVEEELLSRDLAYEIIGDVSFWERKEVRDTMTLIRLLLRRSDELAMYRLLDSSMLPLTALTARKKAEREGLRPIIQLEQIAYPKSGRATLKSKLAEPFLRRFNAIKSNLDLVDINTHSDDYYNRIVMRPLLEAGEDYERLKRENPKLLAGWRTSVKGYQVDGFSDVVKGLYDDYIWPKQKESDLKVLEKKEASTDEIIERLESRRTSVTQVLKVFTDQVYAGATLSEAMEELTLRAEAEPENKQATVKLLTNHAAKGLQFNKVYSIGAEAQSYWRPEEFTPDVIDEEGRNFYVATTRAEQDLAITSCVERFINGETKIFDPLPFLYFLEPHANIVDQRDEYQKKTATTSVFNNEDSMTSTESLNRFSI